ncbi:DegV family protein [Neisseria yangbaofengii]|uniref:DegV family protein n=1 Tax=Neisseria yangbaofengii TaxID=2709396 RepID=UPI0013EE26F3|nr:DegV family protein [Neisseria yangbaofengii]
MSSSYSLYRCAVMSTSTGSLGEVLDRNSLVQILPLRVDLGTRQSADGIEIDNRDYCEWRQKHLDDNVATEPPPQDLLRNTFQYLIKQGYQQVIITTLSHKLSDSADTIRALAADFPQLQIYVVDTGSCCMPEGFFALEAMRLLEEGKTAEEAVAYLERLKPNSHIVFGLRSLQSLSLNGTLSRLGARFSDWLGLRTILHFSEDKLSRLETVGNDEEMFDSVIACTQKQMADKPPQDFVLAGLYSGDKQTYLQFANRFHQKTGLRLGDGVPVSPAVAVHVGIHGVGVGLVEKLKD